MWNSKWIIILVVFVINLFNGDIGFAQSSIENIKQNAKNSLKSKYKFLDGTVGVFTQSHCQEAIQSFGNCFGANPAAPYIIPAFQAPSNEYLDPSYPPSLKIQENGKLYHGVNRIHPTEARVTIIDLPPRAAYFGIQTYLFSKQGQPSNTLLDLVLPSTQHPNPKRFSVFNSMSNSVNYVTINNQLGTSEPWGQGEIAIITTSDKTTLKEVKVALQSSGLASNRIFSETLGYTGKMGLGESRNDYITLIRYALPEDSFGNSYQINPKVTAFRVIAKSRSNTNPYSNQILDLQKANSEAKYQSELTQVSQLIQNKLFQNANSLDFISPLSVGIDTYKCDQKNRNCLGDTRDTDTYLASSSFVMKSSDMFLLTGVNHNRTNNSTYFSISVNDKEEVRPSTLIDRFGNGVNGLSQVSNQVGFAPENYQMIMDNSVGRVFKDLGIQTPQNLNKKLGRYWAVVVARDSKSCQGIRDCYVLPSDSQSGVSLNREIRVLRRVYIKPGSARGPASDKLLEPLMYLGK